MNSMFFIIVDAHSKWVEIFRTPSTTSATVIQCLRCTFTRFGLPHTIVADNASNFTSTEFEEFLKLNGVTHVTTLLYHPQSNGLAKRMVQSFKVGMRKLVEGTVDIKLARFLFSYRTIPHSTTGITPAEVMFGRQLRTRFDFLQPDVASKVSKKQEQQKRIFDTHTKDRNFNLGDYVYARNFLRHSTQKWLPGKIVGRSGNVTFTVQLENNNHVKNHIRNRTVEHIPELDNNNLIKQYNKHVCQKTMPIINDTQPEFETLPKYTVMKFGLKGESVISCTSHK